MSERRESSASSFWSRSKRIRISVMIAVGFYIACVAILATLKATTELFGALPISEMFYGPAITVISSWLMVWAVIVLMRRRGHRFYPIWKDPVGWSRQLARSRTRMAMLITVHCLFVGGGLWSISHFMGRLQEIGITDPAIRTLIVLSGGMPIIFIGVGFPTLYIYAIHRLLQEIDKRGT